MAKEVFVKGINVRYNSVNNNDYICLTDIAKAKNPEHSGQVINNWLRTHSAIEYLGLWEMLYNPNFKVIEYEYFKNKSGENAFVLTAQEWIEKTNAIGLISKSGRYGGTYAHRDIAFKFASWVSTEFELYLIKEFQRLKFEEQKALEWTAKREFVYADEADLLNVALFGKTAGQWREENPALKGNMRDYATIEQLLVIANLESLNAYLIELNVPQADRLKQLNNMARSQLRVLQESNSKLIFDGRKD